MGPPGKYSEQIVTMVVPEVADELKALSYLARESIGEIARRAFGSGLAGVQRECGITDRAMAVQVRRERRLRESVTGKPGGQRAQIRAAAMRDWMEEDRPLPEIEEEAAPV